MDLKIFEPLSACVCYFYIKHFTFSIPSNHVGTIFWSLTNSTKAQGTLLDLDGPRNGCQNGHCNANFRGPPVKKGLWWSELVDFFIDLKTTNKLEFTAWFGVNPTFASRGIILSRTNLWLKKIWFKRNWSKNFWQKNFLGQKKFGPKKMLVLKAATKNCVKKVCQNRVSNSWDIPDMDICCRDKYCRDKCCLDKCC